MRHGQTDYNLRKVVQGSGIDASLNETGRKQSAQFYEAYQHIPFDKVYTSVLKRSVESVQSFIDLGIPHELLPGLNEINWGTREGMMITPQEDAYYHSVIKAWQQGETSLPIEGGESPQDVHDRQSVALHHILNQPAEQTVLICMHGRAMRILLCQMLNYPLRCMDVFEHSNLCLYELTYAAGLFRIDNFNDTSHLCVTES